MFTTSFNATNVMSRASVVKDLIVILFTVGSYVVISCCHSVYGTTTAPTFLTASESIGSRALLTGAMTLTDNNASGLVPFRLAFM